MMANKDGLNVIVIKDDDSWPKGLVFAPGLIDEALAKIDSQVVPYLEQIIKQHKQGLKINNPRVYQIEEQSENMRLQMEENTVCIAVGSTIQEAAEKTAEYFDSILENKLKLEEKVTDVVIESDKK
jgi:capsule polysaccharide export protein KpsE/RkpR